MKNPFAPLTLNKKLGLLLLLLGAAAAVAGDPYRGAETTVDAKELALIVQRELDHVAPDELAEWIIQGKADYRLIDIRSQGEFAAYHIPTAENVQISALSDYGLLRNEKIVLYSEGGIHSAQAWFLLKAQDYKGVFILRGGLEEWKESVLFPALPTHPAPEQTARFEQAKAMSAFFGGTPQTGASPEKTIVATPLPNLETPATATPAGSAPKKKKKEGC